MNPPKVPLALDNPLWDFALAFYARESVSELLLILQDQHQQQVNRLLTCCWLTSSSKLWQGPADVQQQNWPNASIEQLRMLRRQVREYKAQPAWQPYYQALLKAELAGEQLELAHWYVMATEQGQSVADVALEQNLQALGCFDEAARALFESLASNLGNFEA